MPVTGFARAAFAAALAATGALAGDEIAFNGELRVRSEFLDAPRFGIGRDDTYRATGARAYAAADWKPADHLRFLVQLSAAGEHGRKPFERSFDRSAVDVAQAFVEVPFTLAGTAITPRVGRQELDLLGNRLVATRDAANLRRAFDLGLIDVHHGDFGIVAFSGAPVLNHPGAFDDRYDPTERFGGAVARLATGSAPTIEAFYFLRRRANAIYQDARGTESRATWGARIAARGDDTSWAVQAALQSGQVGASRVRAWAIAADWRRRYPLALRPELAVSCGIASGDRHANDGRIETFDVIYPNLSFFTDAPLVFPGNSWYVSPSATLQLPWQVSMQAGVEYVSRLTANDAIYQPPGIPLVRGDGNGGSHAATLDFIRLSGDVASVRWLASYVRGLPGGALEASGAKPANYYLLQLTRPF